MKATKILLLMTFLGIMNISHAQTGTVGGVVMQNLGDGEETVPLTTVSVLKNGKMTPKVKTDFFGAYSINLPEGENTLVFTNRTLQLKADTVILNIVSGQNITHNVMMSGAGQLEEVVITAKRTLDNGKSEVAVVQDVKNDTKVTTQKSRNMIEKTGQSDLGGAAKTMTGMSTVGSSLYVRGLGDRYNVAYMNGLPIPSPHPDFRVAPLSIFPTDIVSSIEVSKVMSSELYGDFSGGAFNVSTRSFYSQPTLKIGIGSGYNTQTTFNDFRTYEGGQYDYFGFDDGTRQIPEYVIANSKTGTLSAVNNIYPNSIYSSKEGNPTGFNDNFGTKLVSALPNSNFSLTAGNFYPTTKSKDRSKGIGFLTLLSHDHSYRYENGQIKIINAQSEERLNYDFDKYRRETATTGLFNLYFRLNPKNNISFNSLFVNNSSDEVRESWGSHFDYPRDVYSRRNTYQQNFISVNQIIGTHEFLPFSEDSSLSRLTIDWRGSYSITGSQEPDRKQFVAFYDEENRNATNSYAFNFIDRNENHIFHSALRESEIAGKVNASYVLKYGEQWNSYQKDSVPAEKIILKVGADYKSKRRAFDYKQYNYILNSLADEVGNNVDIYNMNEFLNSDRHELGQFSIDEVVNFGSSYVAQQQVTGFYSDIQMRFNKFHIIPGVRFESGYQSVENRNQQTPSEYEKNIILSNDILPSLITRFNATDKDVFRFVASKTLTRPKFNEVAPFQYVLYFAGMKAQGNPELDNGTNYNADFRYERYGKPGEMFTVGGFYKYLDRPIEQTMRATASGQLMSFANAQSANVIGAEIEMMKSLAFLVSDSLKRDTSILNQFSVAMNATYMYTSVIIDTTDGGAINTNSIRPLEGASPYLINFDLSYKNDFGSDDDNNKKSVLFAASYNVFGPRLFSVGSNGIGDQYEQPVNSLNFVSSITFNDTYSFGFKAKNILNPTINIVQQDMVNAGETLNVSSFQRGIDFSLSFSYNIPVAKKKKKPTEMAEAETEAAE